MFVWEKEGSEVSNNQSVEDKAEADIFFESSWETCNKVGGIYTVVTSKVEPMLKYYGEGYYCIGPYIPDRSALEFEKLPIPEGFKEIFSELSMEGIHCHYGRWLTKGNPKTILVDFADYSHHHNEIKGRLWEWYQIDSWGSAFWDFDTPLVWGWAVGKLIERFEARNKDKVIVAQFHEWMAASALLYLKNIGSKVGTVFTTHATMLGRAMASADVDIYSMLDSIDPEKEAVSRGVKDKWSMERACAKNASVFTTVSEITGIEAEKLLGTKADVLLLNGLDITKFPTFEEVSIKHKDHKNAVREFLMYYFFPYYTFDLENTLIFFVAGRYEYHDKGMDLMTDALSGLNSWMKDNQPQKTVVVFYWVPSNPRNIRQDVIEAKTYFHDIKETLEESRQDIWMRMLCQVMDDGDLGREKLLSADTQAQLKKKLNPFRRIGTPPLSTHELFDEDKDQIMSGFRRNSLLNRREDRVKVINYPIYLTGADRILDKEYYEAILACSLGIFPSYYEPWGYTPLETSALGIAAVTTDLAGFGRYIKERYPDDNPNKGIFVLERMGKSYEEAKSELIEVLKYYVSLEKHDRIQNRIRANALASLADWKHLAKNYITAHNLAVHRIQRP